MIVDRPKFISAICAFLGSIILIITVYLFITRIIFLARANSSSAPIVVVSHEWVPKGRGGVLAYVPTVRVHGVDVKVDTFNEESVYSIGKQMAVSCNLTRGCIEDTFFAKWTDCLIDFFLSLAFFSPLLTWKFGLWPTNGESPPGQF
jgi:hypothetical protein